MNQSGSNFTSLGNQRDWVWRGWQIRYTFSRVAQENQDSDIPLILLHGFGASIAHWRKNMPFLRQKHTVYALDLLGFGASQKAYTQYKIELWAELIYDFWQSFIGQPVILIGNSIGSLIALSASISYPQIVKGLVMLSIPDPNQRQKAIPKAIQPLVNTLENLVASPLLIRIIFYWVRRPSIIRRSLKLAYVNHQAVTDELIDIICQPTHDQGAARTLIAFTKSTNQLYFAPSLSKLFMKLKVPSLLIWGEKDRLIPPTYIPQLAQQNPQIELQLLEEVGHCPHDECPDYFHQVFANWLAKNYSNW